jgi:hypothetical protein
MSPPRFRLRSLLIAVAVVAVAMGSALWAMRMVRLSRQYNRKAAHHAAECQPCLMLWSESERLIYEAECDRLTGVRNPNSAAQQLPGLIPRLDEKAGYHARLLQKYGRAARYPWPPVAPDPPLP